MRLDKLKLLAAGLAIAASSVIVGAGAQAATVNNDSQVVRIGEEASFSSKIDFKINNKAPKKLKSKVKTVTTSKGSMYNTYRVKAHFDTKNAYTDINAYNNDHNGASYKYYPASASYTLTFKKAGTYKVSYVEYEKESFSFYSQSGGVYDAYTYNYDKQESVKFGTAVYVPSAYVDDEYVNGSWVEKDVTTYEKDGKTYRRAWEGSYYACSNGKNYAYDDDQGKYVPVTITRVNGKDYLKYSAAKIIKVKYVTPYVVLKSENYLQSVKLGSSTNKNYTVGKEGGSTVSRSKGKFLSGKSGKVVVKMGPNYNLKSILVRTYDENGNYVYKLVKNKGTVTYAQNKKHSESAAEDTYKSFSTQMYKTTDILVFYENKTTKSSTSIVKEGVDAEGNQTFVIQVKGRSENPKTKKKQILTTTYNVTRRKNTYSTDYTYSYTRTYQYFDDNGNIQTSPATTGSSYSLPLSNYTTTTFYSK